MIQGLIHSMTVCPDINLTYSQIAYGKGVYFFDTMGKKYIDACSGKAAASTIGHGVPEIGDALHKQSDKFGLYPTHCFSAEIVEEYLMKLTDFSPDGFDRAWITTGGTEAVENAVKLAIQYQYLRGKSKKVKVISRLGSYHGNSFFALGIGGMKARKKVYQGNLKESYHIPAAYSYRKPDDLSISEFSKFCSQSLEDIIVREGPETVAAFVCEPIVAAALGAVPPPDDFYLKEISRICKKYDILFIADEVLTGFGRVGSNFGVDLWDVKPDIIAAGKGISGGYFPIGAVIIHEDIAKIFIDSDNFFLSGCTYACNPMAAAVGIAVIDYLSQHKLIENSKYMGRLLEKKLQRLYSYDIVGDIRGRGLLMAIEFVKNKATKESFPQDVNLSKKIAAIALSRGAVFYPGKVSLEGCNGDHLMIMPPFIINEEQLDEIVDNLEESIKEIMEIL